MSAPFGRTNRTYPSQWWRLTVGPGGEEQARELAGAAMASGAPLEITGGLSLWGSLLADAENPLLVRGGREIEHAQDANHAADLLGAHLIESLSATRGKPLTFYGLVIRRALEEFQIEGAMMALEAARNDDLVQHFALVAAGPALAVQAVWQFHDGFEAVLVGDDHEPLVAMANARRVGVVYQDRAEVPEGAANLITVSEAAQIQ